MINITAQCSMEHRVSEFDKKKIALKAELLFP